MQLSTQQDHAVAAADRLHSAAIHLLRWLRTSDRESGIGPAQLSALSVLVFGGPKSLAELAHSEQVKAPTMTRIVNGLIRAKLATSQPNKRDARAIVVRATTKGGRLMSAARERRVQKLARAVSTIPPNELAALQKAAETMEALSRRL